MSAIHSRREIILIGMALAYMAVGLLILVSIANLILDQQGKVGISDIVTTIQFFIGVTSLLLIVWGFVTFYFRKKDIVTNLNLMIVSLLVFGPLAMEVTLRTGIAAGIPVFRTPELYANPFSDDDYYKLRTIWAFEVSEDTLNNREEDKENSIFDMAYDPILGWVYKKRPDNPLGIITDIPFERETKETPILFYGDSFLAHGGVSKDLIPQQLDALLPQHRVYNFGVSGYGLDQIYLRFRESHQHFKKPIIIVGVLTNDLDRCILKYRIRPKPYFEIEGKELVLKGIPVESSVKTYLENNPVSINSYAGAVILRLVEFFTAGGSRNVEDKKDIKLAISRKILGQLVKEARRAKFDLRFVIFSKADDNGWRKQFLLEEMDRLGVPYLDTAEALHRAMPKNKNFANLYYDGTAHYNALANKIIAEAIARDFR